MEQTTKTNISDLLNSELPKSFDEVSKDYDVISHKINVPDIYDNKLEILGKLIFLRDIYRYYCKYCICSLKPKYAITNRFGEAVKTTCSSKRYIFSFHSKKIRDLFYENFVDMIKEVNEFI